MMTLRRGRLRHRATAASSRGLLAVACLALLTRPGVLVEAQSVERDVPYVSDPHPEQHLDFTWPDGGAASTVLFLHGGSLLESGERRTSPRYADVCEPFVRSGIACATTDYRLAPSFRWPAMPHDVAAAVSTVRELVSDRGGDPSRLFLFGHSSGCQLAGVLATDPSNLTTVDLEPSDLAGAILMGCVLDNYDTAFRSAAADEIREGFERSESDVERFRTAENWLSANPSRFIGPHVPPVLVVVARQERFFPAILEQGARFVRLLKEADVPAELVIVPGTHRSSIEDLDEPDDPTFRAVRNFIDDPIAATDGRDLDP